LFSVSYRYNIEIMIYFQILIISIVTQSSLLGSYQYFKIYSVSVFKIEVRRLSLFYSQVTRNLTHEGTRGKETDSGKYEIRVVKLPFGEHISFRRR
jgi:hypothetical protein